MRRRNWSPRLTLESWAPWTCLAQGFSSHNVGSAGHDAVSALHTTLAFSSCKPRERLHKLGNYLLRDCWLYEKPSSPLPWQNPPFVLLLNPEPKELSPVACIKTSSQNLTMDYRRCFRSRSLTMSKWLFLLDMAACSQIHPQGPAVQLQTFSRRLLLNATFEGTFITH